MAESRNTACSPVLQALLLADRIYTEERGKRIICGTFTQVFSSVFPVATSFAPMAFVLLADVVGEIALQLRFVSLKDNEILMESSPVRVQNADPLKLLDIAVQVPPFPLPHEGIYAFECWADGTMLGSVRIQATQVPSEAEELTDDNND
jgi:hypothetical protein